MSTAVVYYESEAYRLDRGRLMGRQSAGHGFLNALIRHQAGNRFAASVGNRQAGEEFAATVRAMRPDAVVEAIGRNDFNRLAAYGTLSYPAPVIHDLAWARQSLGPRAYSICGVTHTVSSDRVMDAICAWLTAPLQPWDAVVCTSRAVRDVVRNLTESHAEALRTINGATRFSLPRLPIIPLGVDVASYTFSANDKAEARKRIGAGENRLVVLFLGRISWHGKAHPLPMYLALEAIARTRPVTLVECGTFANDYIARGFAEGRAALCPSVTSIVLDGTKAEDRKTAWASADLFCSLSDNVQETFGLTPIEAMAAGIPSVVTDWNGYKDTVRDGIDGFRVPTLSPPPGDGLDLASDHANGVDTYDIYMGRAALRTAVDVEATAKAFLHLADNPDLRNTMGAAARARAISHYDWGVVVGRYEQLWAELAEERRSAADLAPQWTGGWPARPDTWALFAGYPTAQLDDRMAVAVRGDAKALAAILKLSMVTFNGARHPPVELIEEVFKATGKERDVGAVIARIGEARRLEAQRALMLLAKIGLVAIGRKQA